MTTLSLRRNASILRAVGLAGLLALAVLALPAPAAAQPFGAWFTLSGPTEGYIRIPHSPALNPTNRFTLEAWVAITDPNGCSTIAAKDYTRAWWVGVCGNELRSYLKGTSSVQDGGIVPSGWTHIAVVFNGTRRLHYINGEVVLNVPETGPLTTDNADMRIGSELDFPFSPQGSIDEVRLWSVARTQAQIRQFINRPITAPLPGLVGVWALNGNADDVVGSHDGTVGGSGTGFLTFPVAFNCLGSESALCLQDRFVISAKYRTGGPGNVETAESAQGSTATSGILAFPNADTWQVLANVINACSTSGKFTVALSSPSSLFQRIEVFDIRAGVARIYFRYPGPPAAPVIDTASFTNCP